MEYSIVTFDSETIPFFDFNYIHRIDNKCDLHIPMAIKLNSEHNFNIIPTISINSEKPFRVGFNRDNKNGFVRAITREEVTCSKITNPGLSRWLLGLEKLLINNDIPNSAEHYLCYEILIKDIPVNAAIEYSLEILPYMAQGIRTTPATIYSTINNFTKEDIINYSDCGAGSNLYNAYVMYLKSTEQYHLIRIDFVDLIPENGRPTPDINLEIGEYKWNFSWHSETNKLSNMPNINPFQDYIIFTIPKSEIPEIQNIKWRKDHVSMSTYTQCNARMMFIHYCMQGLNDLFEEPNKGYSPPRSFIETTMMDEFATFSSRPNAEEIRRIGDGYVFTMREHDKYGIKYLWTFNGGIITLISQDCKLHLEHIKEYIAKGILEPTIAGFGGHRLPYYQQETNDFSIKYGKLLLNEILGSCNEAYYLDQRLYKQIQNVTKPLVDNVKYIVVDDETGYIPYSNSNLNSFDPSLTPRINQPGLDGIGDFRNIIRHDANPDHQYLWKDSTTNLYILYINSELRNKICGSTAYEYTRGKLNYDLRLKLFYIATNIEKYKKHLLIYSDDADKASGNGWFDGDYGKGENEYLRMFSAALEWISSKPWITSLSLKDIDPESEIIGTIDMRTATCPSVDRRTSETLVDKYNNLGLAGVLNYDKYGKLLHFDAWYDAWKNYKSPWLDMTLEEISQYVEYSIIDWPEKYKNNQLYDLARMNFSMNIHEPQWNKQPLEENANTTDVLEPEDFVISSTLQIRNSLVFLYASIWANLATSNTIRSLYVNAGPVIDELTKINFSSRSGQYSEKQMIDDPLKWDFDLFQNIIIYNNTMLIVLDQNGGRITHLFEIKDNVAICLSGHFKAFQFITSSKTTSGSNLACDGKLIQNTIFTPNHRYIASDVKQSIGWTGQTFDPRPPKSGGGVISCYYPDNFNCYDYEITDLNEIKFYYKLKTPFNFTYYNDDTFYKDLVTDRQLIMEHFNVHGNTKVAPGIVYHKGAEFTKTISINGNKINIVYHSVESDHLVANEFCCNLYESVTTGERPTMTIDQDTCLFSIGENKYCKIILGDNCSFTEVMHERRDNRREYSRALTVSNSTEN